MNGNLSGPSVLTHHRSTHGDCPVLVCYVLHWGMILTASAILQACEQVPQGQGGEPSTAREALAESARLREFVDLLHREIEQLHRDKERLTEVIERLQREEEWMNAERTRRDLWGEPPTS